VSTQRAIGRGDKLAENDPKLKEKRN